MTDWLALHNAETSEAAREEEEDARQDARLCGEVCREFLRGLTLPRDAGDLFSPAAPCLEVTIQSWVAVRFADGGEIE